MIGGGGVGCALHPNSRITDAAASGSNHFMVIDDFPILHFPITLSLGPSARNPIAIALVLVETRVEAPLLRGISESQTIQGARIVPHIQTSPQA